MRKIFRIIPILLATIFVVNAAHAAAWKVRRSVWTEQDEKAYSDFVERLCDSKYSNLNKFIKDPKVNPFYGDEDKNFNLSPDCADLPYLIRAYVAYKLRLPFSYVSEISGNGGDERYSKGNKAKQFKDQDYFNSPQQLFSQVTLVNSGYFRMDASSENSDHYPIKISKKSLTPGTVYYDPDGHVAIVAKVLDNGRIRLIDAHPDKSISKPWFGTKFSKGSKTNGGGFKKWRQIRYTSEGKTVRTQNHNLKDYSATDQYTKTFSVNGKSGIGYHEYVKLTMANSGSHSDPMTEFVFMMQDLFEDIRYRAMAVDVAIAKGCHLKPHPGKLPFNIYGTDGIWEELSTPSRDARLKVAFREFYDNTRKAVLSVEQYYDKETAKALAYNFLLKYDELSPRLCISYINSAGKPVTLNFSDINKRLFNLSFDPYHSIEYRWGATGSELATAHDGETKRKIYAQEQRLRNQLERVYGCHTPLTMGPDTHVSVNIREWLQSYIQGSKVDRNIIAFNKEIIADQPMENLFASAEVKSTNKTNAIEEEINNNNDIKYEKIETIKQNDNPIKENIEIAMVTDRKPVVVPTSIQEEIEAESINANVLSSMEPIEEKQEIINNNTGWSLASVPNNDANESYSDAPIVENPESNIQEIDFWNNLLNKGDQFAAAISNHDNYSKE